ncbi:MAG: hypothetical protein IJV30_09680 [Oscillospiraceae bacterium]|nr:hypothetical protein [Oscillospiraceae bacterium]
MATIGKLKEIDVRELWKHEQYDFSNWLAKAENLEYLNDILGLTLTDVNKEVYVGPYRCDLVAKDETTDATVIIEHEEHRGRFSVLTRQGDHDRMSRVMEDAENATNKEQHRDLSCIIPWDKQIADI